MVRKDGTHILVSFNGRIGRDLQGNFRQTHCVFQDITERKRAEETLRRYELLAKHSREIILFMRRDDGHILEANAAAVAAYGYSREELLEKTVLDLRAPETHGLFVGQIADADHRGILFETVHRRKDGTTFPVEVSSRGATIGGIRTLVSMVRDITERKIAEKKLHRENREMQIANRILKVFVQESGNDLYDKTLDIVLEALESRHGVFGYIDEQGDLICPTMSRLFHECEVEGKCICYTRGKWKGAWSRALLEQRTLYSNQPARVPLGHVPVRNNMAVPILFQDRAIGLFNLANKGSDYTEEDREFIEAVSARIAPVLYARIQIEMRARERERAEEALKKSEGKYRLLANTAGRLLTSSDPQWIVEELCRNVMEHLDCHAFFNFLVDDRTGKLHLNACAGIPEEAAGKIEWLDFGVAVCGCAAQSGERIVAEDIFHTPDLRTELVKSYGIQAYACHPLLVQGQVIGTLSFGTKTRSRFSPEDLDLMKVVADQVATAMERMRLIEALTQSRDHLELRVRERTSALQAQAARLELLNAELQEFAFVASHDLQEPLRKIQSFSDRLRKKFEDSLGEEGCDYLIRMEKAAARMSSLLQALLAYSRVATQGKPFTPIDLGRMAEDAVSDLEIAIEEAGAQVEIGPLPILEADSDQIRQLFQNLIGNALRYRREGEKPLIRVHGSVENGVGRIFVEDSGIGFEERYIDRIFKPFQRLHGRSSPYEGMGMGLAICRKIAERHGGTITARSAPGEGSTFIVTLPVKRKDGGDDQPVCL
jgi:PAS domain S-box-containing protein